MTVGVRRIGINFKLVSLYNQFPGLRPFMFFLIFCGIFQIFASYDIVWFVWLHFLSPGHGIGPILSHVTKMIIMSRPYCKQMSVTGRRDWMRNHYACKIKQTNKEVIRKVRVFIFVFTVTQPLFSFLTVGPDSLTAYCRSLLSSGKFRFLCPYINPDPPNDYCGKEWSYVDVRRLAVLTKEETKEFETKITQNYLKKAAGIQECPRCKSLCERADKTNKRVVCPLCTMKLKRSYDFCWHCLHTWKTSGVQDCGRTCEGLSRCITSPNIDRALLYA